MSQDIFPYIGKHNPGIVGYTATRWEFLVRRYKKWSKDKAIPLADQCYKFVLSNPNVHVCLNAPKDMNQLEANIKALEKGPLSEEEMKFMIEDGDLIHHTKKWFM